MKKFFVLFILLGILAVSSNARADEYADRIQAKKYRKAIVMGCDPVTVKDPATAAALGLLPGGGSFYTGHFALGVVDLLTWPFSSIWDIPLSYSRADRKNQEETIFNCELEKKTKL
jgi:hypothetical protein